MARTNLCTNPKAGTDTSGWTNSNYNTFERVTSLPTSNGLPAGVATALHCVGDSSNDLAEVSFSVTSGLPYWVACYVHTTTCTANGIRLLIKDSGSSTHKQTNLDGTTSEFTRIDGDVTADETDTWTVEIRQRGSGGVEFYFTAVLIEQSSGLRDYFDGGTTATVNQTYAWSGTEELSTSAATDRYGAQRLMTGVM